MTYHTNGDYEYYLNSIDHLGSGIWISSTISHRENCIIHIKAIVYAAMYIYWTYVFMYVYLYAEIN